MNAAENILIIEDDAAMARGLSRMLTNRMSHRP